MQTSLQKSDSPFEPFYFFNKRITLILILVLALLLRLYRIDQPYTDLAGWRQTSMAMMADNFYKRNGNILYPEVSWNGPGESYNGREFQILTYTSSLLYRVLGQHDWIGRMVAVLFGVWGVFALYHLVRRVWDQKRALASAALLALLPAAIYFDRSFLPDPAMVSLVTTSLWMLVAYLQTDKKKYLLLTALIGCLGFLGKITGMLALLPMLYATLTILHARQKLTGPNLLRILVPGLVVVAVVAAYYLWARYLSLHYPPYHFAGSENWLWDEGIGTWLGQSYFLPRAFFIFKNWMWGLPFIVLFISGFIISFLPARYNKQRASEEPAVPGAPYLFHFWLIGCIVFYLIGAKEQIGNFWNFHLWSPVVAAFSANAVVFLLHTFQKQRVLAWASLAVIGAAIAISNRYVIRNVFTDQYYKADYQMGMHLSSLKKKGDLVVVLARETGCPIPIYYSKGRGWVFPPAGKGKWDQLPASDEECIVTLEELRGKGAAWFGVYEEQYKRLQAGYPKFVQHLATRYPRPVAQPGYVIFKLQHDKN